MDDPDSYVGQGMQITKMVNGKSVVRLAIKGDTIARMDWIVEMDARHRKYLTEQDWKKLAQLADEYQAHGMTRTASEIRKELYEQ